MTPKIHHNDVPSWVISETEQPSSYLDFLGEPSIPQSDGKGDMTMEDHFLRSQFIAAVDGDQQALEWLLKRIIKESKEELATAEAKGRAVVRGIPRVTTVLPAMTALGCVTTNVQSSGEIAVRAAEWFETAISRYCHPDRLVPVRNWLDAGGVQKPAVPESDLWD